MDEHTDIRKERNAIHGDPIPGHTNLGKAWGALLAEYFQRPVPPLPCHLVCLMLVTLKLQRAARPMKYTEDDYLDARNYLDFAQEAEELKHGPHDPSGH